MVAPAGTRAPDPQRHRSVIRQPRRLGNMPAAERGEQRLESYHRERADPGREHRPLHGRARGRQRGHRPGRGGPDRDGHQVDLELVEPVASAAGLPRVLPQPGERRRARRGSGPVRPALGIRVPTGDDADAASATGTVTEVGQVADASSGVATYPVTISFDSTSGDFFVGSTVTGEIATQERADVIQVSSLAVTTANGTSTVTVSNGRHDDRPDRDPDGHDRPHRERQHRDHERAAGRREGRHHDHPPGRRAVASRPDGAGGLPGGRSAQRRASRRTDRIGRLSTVTSGRAADARSPRSDRAASTSARSTRPARSRLRRCATSRCGSRRTTSSRSPGRPARASRR